MNDVPDEFADLAGMISRAEQSADRQRADDASPEVIAARGRRRKRRLITAGVVALVIAAMVGTNIPVMLLTPMEHSVASASDLAVSIPDAASIRLPDFGASAVSVTGADQFPDLSGSGGILASSGGNDPRPIASITKIVTALVILEANPIGATEPGPSVTFSGTTIVEPTGLDPRNLSTPTDLIAMGGMVMAHPVLADLVGTPGIVAANGRGAGNTNALLGSVGIDGIKTGTLDASGACLLFSAVVDAGGVQLSVIGVVLGGYNHHQVNSAVVDLLESLKAGFHEVPVMTAGQKLGSYTTPWGAQASAVAMHDASLFTWSNMPVTWTMSTDAVGFAETGAEVGRATFVSGDAKVTVPIVLDGPLEEPDAWWRLTHPHEVLGL